VPGGWGHVDCTAPAVTITTPKPEAPAARADAETFDLLTPGYNPAVVDRIKAWPWPERRWVKPVWKIKASRIFEVASIVEKAFPEVAQALREDDAYAPARKVAGEVEATREASRATDADVDLPCPEGLAYMPFQKAGIAYALGRPTVLIGDEMGLGKTIQAIGVMNTTANLKSALVVCPASLRLNWAREIEKWLTHEELTVGVAQGKHWPATDIVIVNYDILQNFKAELDCEWDVLITDECHYLKNPKTKRTKAVLGYWDAKRKVAVEGIRAKRKVFLTGTPIVNRPVELWPLLKALDPQGLGRGWKSYVERYCDGHQKRAGRRGPMVWDVTGASNLSELQDRLRETFMVRRLKADVLTELPAKRRQVIEFPANGAAQVVKAEQKAWAATQADLDALRAAVELAKASDDEADYAKAVSALHEGEQAAFTELARLRHETALAKVSYVVEHLLNATDKVVCFGHHRDVIGQIVEALREAGERVVVITGDTPMQARQDAVDAFQTDPSVRYFVANIQAAGVGLTLTAASHVVFAELDWVPGNVSQAEDRCHRIGQTASVLAQHLVLEGSLDAHMAKILVAKQEVIDKALDKDTTAARNERLVPVPASATKQTSRKQVAKAAESLKPSQVEAIHEALRTVAGVCDGARKKDGMGFNGIDTNIGKALAGCEKLTAKQAVLGKLIIIKYRRQIGDELLGRILDKAPEDIGKKKTKKETS
jgi:SWI/SNF-related matrix-associated actin-dependent regulator 1 of chromatin subfamily A